MAEGKFPPCELAHRTAREQRLGFGSTPCCSRSSPSYKRAVAARSRNAALVEPGRHVIAGCRRKSSGSLAVANIYCSR